MERASIDLAYMEETNFHIERVVVYLTPNLPLMALHQARAILLFFYFMSLSIIILLTQHMVGPETIIGNFETCFALMLTLFLHLFMTVAYCVLVLFTGSSARTVFRIIWYLHAPVPLAGLTILLYYFVNSPDDLLFFCLVCVVSAIGVDFIIGIAVERSERVFLVFEGLGAFPALLLWTLQVRGILSYPFLPFVPLLAAFLFYFFIVIGLATKPLRKMSAAFLTDRRIRAEFIAASDFESYWNAALWRDDTNAVPDRRSSSSDDSSEPPAVALLDVRKRDFRFPRKEKFQLYKLDGDPKNPFFVSSIPTVLSMFALLLVGAAKSEVEVPGFPFVTISLVLLSLLTLLVNSRAISQYMFCVTNISSQWIDIMWDHPSFATM